MWCFTDNKALEIAWLLAPHVNWFPDPVSFNMQQVVSPSPLL
jgi:hypothetical protein